jgi:hypothetical protein
MPNEKKTITDKVIEAGVLAAQNKAMLDIGNWFSFKVGEHIRGKAILLDYDSGDRHTEDTIRNVPDTFPAQELAAKLNAAIRHVLADEIEQNEQAIGLILNDTIDRPAVDSNE